ncbi:MAG: hypothetical protein IIV14_00615 [Bacteroidaceae bacterium]|nr:hypothetical protein [Bacteroidaceae bacterium]
MGKFNAKHDRQGVRKASDIEQKYNLGADLSDVIKIAADAQKVAQKANDTIGVVNADIADLKSRVETLESSMPDISQDGETLTIS